MDWGSIISGSLQEAFGPTAVIYALAAIGPFAVGLVHDATGGWTAILVFLALTAVPLTVAGVRVARPDFVDDEI